mgnify:CR=1 FL=1
MRISTKDPRNGVSPEASTTCGSFASTGAGGLFSAGVSVLALRRSVGATGRAAGVGVGPMRGPIPYGESTILS